MISLSDFSRFLNKKKQSDHAFLEYAKVIVQNGHSVYNP